MQELPRVPRFDYAAMVREIRVPESYAAFQAPYIAMDECFNNDDSTRVVVNLCNQGLASGSCPLWNEHRTRSDGSVLYVLGGLTRRDPFPAERGVPTKNV